jgi:hypothetical protein
MAALSAEGSGGVGHPRHKWGAGATAADVAGHGAIDFLGRRLLASGQGLEEGRRTHDLAALAVAALRDVVLDSCGVHGSSDTVAVWSCRLIDVLHLRLVHPTAVHLDPGERGFEVGKVG